ncbi:hypothetical protein M622_08890 [Thauera terpenica 58Eu]|jgi:hypothetical protein|uniref:Uncharacterized protein n=1 Tax=Thauera terpenica 58Eu TaxID=1348657 RepID=T0ALR6_9RHOO|nr:DUF192 domain-containing protein [Thauera terpenica]EPZ13799.1 hypothetical protein M622_08890 [Thauera terpenica 58Eu]MBP6726813.1 DUF192 domain-containing protein [Thauera sp.]MBP6760317.1 DUF192 domain-containing protein [Thauera sp.]
MKRQSIMKGALLGAVLCAGPSLAQPMPLAELGAGMYRIEAEVAHTAQARQVGLMMRKTMAPQRGMVFVFEHDATHCMWMKNTFLPLSVAFVDAQGKVINIEDMQPQSEDNHCAAAPARFALEMNLGWFRERGIKAGDVLRGFDRLPAAR